MHRSLSGDTSCQREFTEMLLYREFLPVFVHFLGCETFEASAESSITPLLVHRLGSGATSIFLSLFCYYIISAPIKKIPHENKKED